MSSDWVRLAREVITGRRRVKIESNIGAYNFGDGRPLILVSVVNIGKPIVRVTSAALTTSNGHKIPFVTSRVDMSQSSPWVLSETEEHVFAMDLDNCIRYLRSTTPTMRLQDVLIYATTGDFREPVAANLRAAEETWVLLS